MYSFRQPKLWTSLEPAPSGLSAQILAASNLGTISWTDVLNSELDDVIVASNLASFPVSPSNSKLFLALDTKLVYYYNGSSYVLIACDLNSATGNLDLASKTSNILPVPSGGTGCSNYAVGDLLAANTVSSLAKLSSVATGNCLVSGGINSSPFYSKISSLHCNDTVLTVGNISTVPSGQVNTELNQTSTNANDHNQLIIRANKSAKLWLASDNDNTLETSQESPSILMTQDSSLSSAQIVLGGSNGVENITSTLSGIENCLVIHQTSSSGAAGIFLGCGGAIRLVIYAASIQSTLPLILPHGTLSNCSLSFASNVSSGLTFTSAGAITNVISGGSQVCGFGSTITAAVPLILPVGSSSACALGFAGNVNSGLIFAVTNAITSIISAGTLVAAFSGGGSEIGAKFFNNIVLSGCDLLMGTNNLIFTHNSSSSKFGTATLSSGSVVVYTTRIFNTSSIFLTRKGVHLNSGNLSYINQTNTVSFEIVSSNASDNGSINWLILDSA